MAEKARAAESVDDFNEKVRQLGDEQLREILKKRKLYQEPAANAAIREAIKREIISSEEDLHAPEYRHEPLKPKLFPKIENPAVKSKIRKSISRGLLLAGILPTIWGIVRMNAGSLTEGLLLLSFGVFWMGISASQIRSYSLMAVRLHLVLAVISAGYTIRWMTLSHRILFMDLFVVLVLYLMILYGLFYILRLRE